MREIVVAGACRTAIGKMGGILAQTPVCELGAEVIRESLIRAQTPAELVDQVLMGCALTSAQGQNVARQAAVKAGIPVSVPAATIGNVCGSGLLSVNIAASMIRSADAGIIVAGGMENMSQAPYALKGARFGYRMGDGEVVDTMARDALRDAFSGEHMGVTAENIAWKYNISRLKQDEFSACSQEKYQIAQMKGKFANEILPMRIANKKEILLFDKDENPRAGVTAQSLAALKPVFRENGTVTAGNSSGINDGAAALVVMSGEKAREIGIKPTARIISGASAGCDPNYMGMGPVYAIGKALNKCGMKLEDIGLIELNEAFAAQSLAVIHELGMDSRLVNVNGGAIALGHPVGASGCRILVTLIHEMQRRGVEYGLASLCVGGGMGVATIVQCYK